MYNKKIKTEPFWKKYYIFVVSILFFGLLAMLGNWTWFTVFLYKLPYVYQVRELVRYEIFIQLSMVMMFAIAFEVITKVVVTARQKIYLSIVAAFILINSIYVYMLRKAYTGFSTHYALQIALLGLGLLFITIIKITLPRRLLLAFLIFIVMFVNIRWFIPKLSLNSYLPSQYKISTGLTEILEKTNGKYRVDIEGGTLPINVGDIYDFQTVGGYGGTVYAPYYEVQQNQPFVAHLPQHASNLYSHISSGHQVSHEVLSDLLGIKYVVTKSPLSGDVVVYQDEGKHVYVNERPTVLSKLFTTSSLNSINRNNYSSLPVTTITYNDEYQKYFVDIHKPEIVIASEIQYPGWKLIVDGKNATWKAYYVSGIPLLRSFYLSSGQHTVEFVYRPFVSL